MTKQKIFTPEFLKEIGFKLVKEEKSKYPPHQIYGEAIDVRTNGMTVINWNEEGAGCTYFGEKLEPNTWVYVGKDGGTRAAFNGYVFTQDDMRKVLQLTW